jgi:hypothetical protein
VAQPCDAGQPCNPTAGFEGVDCRLDLLDGTLVQTAPDQVGGTKPQKKLRKKITTARKFVVKASTGRSAEKNLRKAANQLTALARQVERGVAKEKINPAVGDALIGLARDGVAQLGRLQAVVQ